MDQSETHALVNGTQVDTRGSTRQGCMINLGRQRLLGLAVVLFCVVLTLTSWDYPLKQLRGAESGNQANIVIKHGRPKRDYNRDSDSEANNNSSNGESGDVFSAIDENEDDSLDCSKEAIERLTGSELRVREADCGTGYVFDDGNKNRNMTAVRVVLYGQAIRENLGLSGCPLGAGRCFHHPKCTMVLSSNLNANVLSSADVIVTANPDAMEFKVIRERTKRKIRRVLYWREAYWTFVSQQHQRDYFDLQMGVHYTSGILNPNYMRRPRTLLSKNIFKFLPFEKRTSFALSIISNCNANSERQAYIDQLSDYLGKDRVHQYGVCGNRKLPPPPLQNAAKVIAKYKFYLSFENTIQNGYVSEKLMTVLNMQLVPVYLGAFNVPNITKVPSFIQVRDFDSPKELALYLLYLDSNPEEYAKYHLWREDASLFTDEYLELIKRKFPSPTEVKAYGTFWGRQRMANCCRLCNLDFLDEQIARRTQDDFINRPATSTMINRYLFNRTLYNHPGSAAYFGPEFDATKHTVVFPRFREIP